MTIDEAIKWLEHRIERCDAVDAYSVKCEYEDVLELIKELKCYREQDLIRREDVNYALYDEPILDTTGTCYGLRPPSRAMLQERILRIPKAEPFKENNL